MGKTGAYHRTTLYKLPADCYKPVNVRLRDYELLKKLSRIEKTSMVEIMHQMIRFYNGGSDAKAADSDGDEWIGQRDKTDDERRNDLRNDDCSCVWKRSGACPVVDLLNCPLETNGGNV